MATSRRSTSTVADGAAMALHLRTGEEAVAGADSRLAAVFQQIRAIHHLSEMDMARRLGTGVDVVLSFEAGAVDLLPAWPETARLVERYAELGGVDPAPILSRLLNLQTMPVAPAPRRASAQSAAAPPAPMPAVQRLLPPLDERMAPPPRPGAAASPTVLSPPPSRTGQAAVLALQPPTAAIALPAIEPAPIGFASHSKLRTTTSEQTVRTRPPVADEQATLDDHAAIERRHRRLRRTALAASPFIAVLLLAVLVHVSPGPVYGLARALPGPLGSTTRGVLDVIVLQTATFKDGLRWIDPADPRDRKSHRL